MGKLPYPIPLTKRKNLSADALRKLGEILIKKAVEKKAKENKDKESKP